MSRPLSALALLAGLLACDPSRAGTVWLCGLSDELTRIVCIADTPSPADDDAPPPVAGQVRGTQFPLDPRRQWVVDMWSPATDPDSIAQLARATMCWRSPGCEVVMNTAVLGRQASARSTRR
jgi:hypothetical protein